MVVTPKHPKMIIFSRRTKGEPMVVGYHHFRKHPDIVRDFPRFFQLPIFLGRPRLEHPKSDKLRRRWVFRVFGSTRLPKVFFSQKTYRKYQKIINSPRVLCGDQLLIQRAMSLFIRFLPGKCCLPVLKNNVFFFLRCFGGWVGKLSFFPMISALGRNFDQIFRSIFFCRNPGPEERGDRTWMIGMWSSLILFPQTKIFKQDAGNGFTGVSAVAG